MPARRGDLLIVTVFASTWAGRPDYDARVGVVTGITRDGNVRYWVEAGHRDQGRVVDIRPHETWVIRSDQVTDMRGALADFQANGREAEIGVMARLRPFLTRDAQRLRVVCSR